MKRLIIKTYSFFIVATFMLFRNYNFAIVKQDVLKMITKIYDKVRDKCL